MKTHISNISIRNLALLHKGWSPASVASHQKPKGYVDATLNERPNGCFGITAPACDWNTFKSYQGVIKAIKSHSPGTEITEGHPDVDIDFSGFPDCQIMAFGKDAEGTRFVILKLI